MLQLSYQRSKELLMPLSVTLNDETKAPYCTKAIIQEMSLMLMTRYFTWTLYTKYKIEEVSYLSCQSKGRNTETYER